MVSIGKVGDLLGSVSDKLSEILGPIPKPDRGSIITATVVSLAFAVAFLLRIMPLKYGVYLNEYDPYFQYYMTKWIVKHGWSGFIQWFSWTHDPNFWYPMGRNVVKTAYPGVAFTGAFIYLLLKSLGINTSLIFVSAMVPVIFNSLVVVAVYFLARDLYGRGAGIFASLTVGVAPSMLGRSLFGFYDDDNLAILFLVIGLYAFIKGFKNRSKFWMVVSGLSFGYVVMTWGAYTYVLNLMALFLLAAMVLGMYDRPLGETYLVSMTIALLFVAALPKTRPFLTSTFATLPYIAYATIGFYEVLYRRTSDKRRLILSTLGVMVAVGLLLYGLETIHVIKPIIGKFLVVINPLYKTRNPWFESVGEHQTSTWYSFFMNFNVLLFFAPLGMYIALKRGRKEDLLIALYTITSLHAMSSLIRLSVLLTPAMAVVGGAGLAALVEGYAKRLYKGASRRREREQFRQLTTVVLSTIIIILLLGTIATPFAWSTANQPQSILSAETGSYTLDWISAFSWMRANIPKGSVVASWWDYGYWITVNTGLPSTCDNANFNLTQIQLIGRALMGNETVALKIFKELNVSYVLVFENFIDVGKRSNNPNLKGYFLPIRGDFEKSVWMARIGYGYTEEQVREYYIKQQEVLQGFRWQVPAGTKAPDTTLYRMLFIKIPGVREKFLFQVNIPPPEHFKLVFASKPNAFVLIYKVIYSDQGS